MKKYFSEYIAYIQKILLDGKDLDYSELKREHLVKIKFMQHERLIHFLVTMLFSIVLFICIFASFTVENVSFIILIILLLILLVPYISHYYFLENTCQKMYKIYDQICEKERTDNEKK